MVSLAILLFVFLIQLLCNMKRVTFQEFPLFSGCNFFCSMTIYLIMHSVKWKVFNYILPEQVFKGRVRHCKITTLSLLIVYLPVQTDTEVTDFVSHRFLETYFILLDWFHFSNSWMYRSVNNQT